MEPLSLIFDLDGTLVDTAPDLTGATNAVLTAHGRAKVPASEVRHMVGLGARKLLERGFAYTGEPATEQALDGYFHEFLDYYGAHVADDSYPFEGAISALQGFKTQGHRLGVCTNKPEALSVALLKALNLAPYFSAVLGADTIEVRKPNPRHLLETVSRIGGNPKRAVMIGDSEVDAETAKAAGIPLVIFTFGYSALDPATFGADELLHSYDELPAAIDRVAARMDRA